MKNPYKHNDDGSTSIFYTNKFGETFETIIDTEDFPIVNKLKNTWFISKNGQNVKFRVKGKINGKNVYLYRLIMNPEDNQVVDHIDGNTLNNRRQNLRAVTTTENSHNKNITGRKTPRNVSFNPNSNKYRVSLFLNGKRLSFGQYHTIEEAEKVAIEARRKHMPTSFI